MGWILGSQGGCTGSFSSFCRDWTLHIRKLYTYTGTVQTALVEEINVHETT